MEPNTVNALVYIAQNQGYFADNGLDVKIKDYVSGLAAVNGVLNHEVDLATATEFVIVGKALSGESIRTCGTIDKFTHIFLLARGDRGIMKISDLQGKRIGLALWTASEFYFGRFLELNGMEINDVTLVNINPAQSRDALVKGDIDAVVAWQPNIKSMEDRIGNLVRWSVQSAQPAYDCVISTNIWIDGHPDLVIRFLDSLVKAETYNLNHPDEARNIVQKRFDYENPYILSIWPQYRLAVSLEQSLITAMEDEARWMIRNKLTPEIRSPNFLNYIYVDGLKAVKPQAVNIIR